MYLPLTKRQAAKYEPAPGLHITKTDVIIALRMFVHAFGPKPLQAHPDLKSHHFYYMHGLEPWEMGLALQIAVDTTAACDVDDERVTRMKKHFRDLLGTCEHETLVTFCQHSFVIERPSNTF